MSKEELKKYLFDKGFEQKDYSKPEPCGRNDFSRPRKAEYKSAPSIKNKKIKYSIIVNRSTLKARIIFDSKCFDSSNMESFINSISKSKLEQFLIHFGQSVIDYPNSADLYYYRGLAHLKMMNLDQAISDFKNALSIDSNHYFANKKFNETVSQTAEIEKKEQKSRGEGFHFWGGTSHGVDHGDDSPG